MAGELSAMAELTPSQIAALAATETLAITLYSGGGLRWEALSTEGRNEYRQTAARMMIENHNEASNVDALVVPPKD